MVFNMCAHKDELHGLKSYTAMPTFLGAFRWSQDRLANVLVDKQTKELAVDTTAVPIWSEQPHYKHHSIRLKCEERVTCLLQWKGVRMSV